MSKTLLVPISTTPFFHEYNVATVSSALKEISSPMHTSASPVKVVIGAKETLISLEAVHPSFSIVKVYTPTESEVKGSIVRFLVVLISEPSNSQE